MEVAVWLVAAMALLVAEATTGAFVAAYFAQIAVGTASGIEATARWVGRAPTPADFEPTTWLLGTIGRKLPAIERDAQLAALRSQIGEVPPENIVNLHPVPIERPPWRPTEVPDESVADALVGLVPPPPEVEANGVAGDAAASEAPPAVAAEVPSAEPGDRPADTLDPHG